MSKLANLFMAYVIIKKLTQDASLMKMNSMILPGGNMGISRSQMPQIPGDKMQDYISFLKGTGLKISTRLLPSSKLKLTQNEYNKEKVLKLMKAYDKIRRSDIPPIIVSSDNFVLDGSHRFAALHNLDPNGQINVVQVSAPIRELLNISRAYPFAQYRTVSDKKIAA